AIAQRLVSQCVKESPRTLARTEKERQPFRFRSSQANDAVPLGLRHRRDGERTGAVDAMQEARCTDLRGAAPRLQDPGGAGEMVEERASRVGCAPRAALCQEAPDRRLPGHAHADSASCILKTREILSSGHSRLGERAT